MDSLGKANSLNVGGVGRVGKPFQGELLQGSGDALQHSVSDGVELRAGGTRDVIIMAGKDLKKHIQNISADTLAENLMKMGVEIEEKLEIISGVTATINKNSASKLEEEGYILYDNGPRKSMFSSEPGPGRIY
jgi:hypothetical protein